MAAIEWIYKCGNDWNYCDDGFCDRYNQLKEDHKRPAVEMSQEWKGKTDKDWKPGAIQNKFHMLTNRKPISHEEQNYETCTIADLDRLIDSGKKFGAIYADPPWAYSNQATRSSTDKHYQTMSISDICDMPIAKLCSDNCHLHLWTTNAFIFETPKIFEAWGFHYKSIFVWVKPQMGIGNYWRVSHEFLITAIKEGSTTFLNKAQKSWAQLNRTKHSTKPEDVAKKIEAVSPGPYIELFARQMRPGWTVWGNEIKKELFDASYF